MSQDKLDLVVLGATGFTGRQAAAYIARHGPSDLRVALAARSADRLARVREQLGPAGARWDQAVVDTLDADGVDALVRRARVVLTTVGPYAAYGSHVLAACARHGTHYVDITGETPWVRRMIDQHDEEARATGARIVPFCGFDSVPSDLGAMMMARWIRSHWDQPTRQVRAVFRMRGGFNGGTVASALGAMERGELAALADPFLLNPASHRPGPAADRSRDVTGPALDAELGGWTAPFFMAPVNTRVVRRSAALLDLAGQGYGPDFAYQEVMWAGRGLSGRLSAATITGGMALYATAGSRAWARGLIRRLAPAPGEGPTEAAMDGGFFRADLLAEAGDGRVVRGLVHGDGDPGNRSTVRMLCEAALLLCARPDGLPDTAGVSTPAVALGEPYLDALRRTGMRWEVAAPD